MSHLLDSDRLTKTPDDIKTAPTVPATSGRSLPQSAALSNSSIPPDGSTEAEPPKGANSTQSSLTRNDEVLPRSAGVHAILNDPEDAHQNLSRVSDLSHDHGRDSRAQSASRLSRSSDNSTPQMRPTENRSAPSGTFEPRTRLEAAPQPAPSGNEFGQLSDRPSKRISLTDTDQYSPFDTTISRSPHQSTPRLVDVLQGPRNHGPKVSQAPPKRLRVEPDVSSTSDKYPIHSQEDAGRFYSSENVGAWKRDVHEAGGFASASTPSTERPYTPNATRTQSSPGSERTYSSHFMTLQTDQGPLYLPVDTQAASRVADEKRRRNAGASARFRARRKEREQASSREIDELRSVIRELGDEVEFYKGERDYLVSALWQGSDRARHFPRPPSPRRFRRASLPEEPGASVSSADLSSPSNPNFGQPDSRETSPRVVPSVNPAYRVPANVEIPSRQPGFGAGRLEGPAASAAASQRGQQALPYAPEPQQYGPHYAGPPTQGYPAPPGHSSPPEGTHQREQYPRQTLPSRSPP